MYTKTSDLHDTRNQTQASCILDKQYTNWVTSLALFLFIIYTGSHIVEASLELIQ